MVMSLKCCQCKEVKPREHFTRSNQKSAVKHRGGYDYSCKACNVKEAIRFRQIRWEELDKYKRERGCAHCGYREHGCALDLHHRDGSTKVGSVSQMLRLKAERLWGEVAKCEVLCANCHRVEHWRGVQ